MGYIGIGQQPGQTAVGGAYGYGMQPRQYAGSSRPQYAYAPRSGQQQYGGYGHQFGQRHERLTAEQRADRLLQRADANGDGLLTQTELTAVDRRGDAIRAAALISRADTDGDGSVSRAELIAADPRAGASAVTTPATETTSDATAPTAATDTTTTESATSTDAFESLWARIDTDGDGTISRSELLALFGITETTATVTEADTTLEEVVAAATETTEVEAPDVPVTDGTTETSVI